ncbi:hypothetical protein PHMEG_0008895 [Phytophthora megakarya]|uniref:Uncharacterized protein n=1 Tax=Phytophthora megakarya TaxID=4795 RepID=A0A225WK27_9STRA|nr:hypothetical protein PHMEG_0008895 [Phytophthora megakarya]
MSAAQRAPVSSLVSASTVASTPAPVLTSASVSASSHVSAVTPTPLSGTTEKNFSVDKYFELQEKKIEHKAKQRAGAAKPDRPKTIFDGSSIFSADGGIPVDYEDGELEDEGTSSSLSHESKSAIGTRRPREDESDASSSKRPRRYWSSKKTSGRTRVPEWQALCQSWNQFVANFNNSPAAYRERIASARERFMRFSKTSVVQRVHEGYVNANIPCAVSEGFHCPHCPTGPPRISERDLTGYTTNRVSLRSYVLSLLARVSILELCLSTTPRVTLHPAVVRTQP